MKNRLKVIRAERSMTQADLAKETGISRTTLSEIENGTSNPSARTVLKLAKTLNLPMEEIFLDFNVV